MTCLSMKLILHVQLLNLAIIFTQYGPGECQSKFLEDLGPRNITRFENHPNVYIPCPFSGSANPIWRINGVEYEAFNLPNNMLPVSYGLLITTVELGMDGKSFQCVLLSGQSQELSSIGILTVLKSSQEYTSFYSEHGVNIEVPFSPTFSLNHQNTIFEDQSITFSWNMDDACNMYRVTSVNCDDEEQRSWDNTQLQGTSLTIPSSFLVDNRNHSLYFTLESFSSDGHMCNRINTDFAVLQSDITEDQPTSYSGTCVDVQSMTGFPVVMLPSKTKGNDCPCSITTTDTYNLTRCSCADDTIFIRSFSASTLKLGTNTYRMCFVNLTRDMNNTVIHVYDSYRYCINDDGSEVTKAYRMYLRSFKLLIELPYKPSVSVDTETGEVQVSSDEAEGIKVAHYKVVVKDVTNLTVDQKTIPHDANNASFGDLFQQHTCSPYSVTVSAYSTLGKSNSITTMVESGNRENKCDCIAQNVEVDLDLLEGDSESDSDVTKIVVQVNCTHIHYEDDVMLDISIRHRGVPINESFNTICQKTARFHYIPQLQCDQRYDLRAYWIQPDSNTRCKLTAESLDMTVSCPGSGKGNADNTAIIVGASLGGFGGVATMVIILLTCLVFVLCGKLRKSKNSHNIPT